MHEGIDLRKTDNDNESFRTIISGTVVTVEKDGVGYGKLVVSHPNNTNRIIYAHASDYADNVVAGQSIDGDSFRCYQGSTRAGYAHVHIEAGGSTATGLAQDRDDSLARVAPYNLLYDYVSSIYK